jgi:hypothetical protein
VGGDITSLQAQLIDVFMRWSEIPSSENASGNPPVHYSPADIKREMLQAADTEERREPDEY